MVIAKCLRSPQQGSLEMAASAGTTVPRLFSLIGMKLKFNNLGGFFRRRHKFPFLHGILANLNEQGVSPDDPRAFHTSFGRDDDFDFDFAGNVHSFCEIRIQWQRLGLDLALGFIRRTRLCKSGRARKNERRTCGQSQFFPPANSHRHYSSMDWKMPRVREGTSDAMADSCGNSRIGTGREPVSNRRTVSHGRFRMKWRMGFAVPL